ncbi:MAG TPA: hypothetical protein VG937_05635 [Polyangiaceae bacterium]|nr:hypothetical protein [Polyangiaceae bacterium]
MPTLVSELAGGSENPSLTSDSLELYFTSARPDRMGDTGGNVWLARRTGPQATFNPPIDVAEVNTPDFETSAAISADGLTLWIGSDRPGGAGLLDIWRSTRASRAATWSLPTNLPELSSPARDVPRPLGDHGRTMPLGSERNTPDRYQTYLADRASPSDPFSSPRPIPELTSADGSTVDGFLTDDGLTLFFSSAVGGGPADLFLAVRASVSEPFSHSAPLRELNTPADERDPFLTADGSTFYFVSNRDGLLNIYQTAVIRRPGP